jgi:putative membrane protein
MPATDITSLSSLPAFFAYFVAGVALLLLFSFVYTMITPHNELPLIRQGNVAAGIGFGGALLGYTLPLASAISHSIGFEDMLAWGAVGLVVQIAVLGIARLAIPGLFRDIEKGKTAPAVLLAVISLSAGMINAAAMTY